MIWVAIIICAVGLGSAIWTLCYLLGSWIGERTYNSK
jgi:hypothetical protein